jgi:pimeloyl-ACP methyl ester carboxylesterase
MKPVMWGAAPWLRRHRAGTTEAIGPAAGDILLYQARGDAIRDRLRDAILGCAEPVVLIGHSLGGIIAVDLLADCAKTAARVPVLITVGSQAPYLYEINALRSLPFGERLPEHFPERWVNFWDPRDLLSYLAEAVFAQRGGRDAGKRVEDVRVNTREPFHWSHSAYFKRRALFERLADEIRAVAADGAR